MKRIRLAWRGGRLAVLTAIGWLASDGAVWAQAFQKRDEKTGGSYVPSYMLVILGVGLGVLVVCLSSHRRDRARPEGYEEAKIGIKE
jgi:hypothetical protein